MMRKYLKEYNEMGEDERNIDESPEKKRFASSHPNNINEPFFEDNFANDYGDEIVEQISNNNEKIFDGSPYSKFDYCMSISMLARKIKLSDRNLDKVLSFINFFMPASNKCPCDIRTLKKFLNEDMKVHEKPEKIYHCNKCSKQQKDCICKSPNIQHSYFQIFDIVHQITPILKKYSTVREKYAAYCNSQETGSYIDALTGSARKQYQNDIIGLSLYTDGLQLRKSSNNELWILGANLLDLPPKIRSSQKNFIFLLAWYGPIKPIWTAVSDRINIQLSSVVQVGEDLLQMAVLQVNADIPARASLLNCMQSGYCPCLRCNVKGIRIGESMQYQKFENDSATTRSYLDDIKKNENASKKGVAEVCAKGPVAFTHLFVPECVTADVMHTVYYGPIHDDIKSILKNKICVQLFDAVISTTLWPSELCNRKLRPISEINLYKASEWKTLILYVTVPVLSKFLLDSPNISDILKKQCENILQGISALLLLMKDIVSEADVYKANGLIKTWFNGRKDIFQHNPYTIKAHDFTHFPDQVHIHGPLQTSSCFAGENILNKISNMVSSNHGEIILKQIAERSLQEIKIADWKTHQEKNDLQQLIYILDNKSNKADQFLPSDSKLAQESGISVCIKKAKIGDYEFCSSNLSENEKNSYCIFKYQNTLRVGCIEYITEMNGEIFVQIQPYHCEPSNNFHEEIEFKDYYYINQKLNDPIVCGGDSVYKKGFVVTQNSVNTFVPLAHVYEHN